jgi:hypothetical protein
LQTQDERRFAAAESAIFLVAFYLILHLGYFWGIIEIDSGSSKSGSLFRLSLQFDPTSFLIDPREAAPFA